MQGLAQWLGIDLPIIQAPMAGVQDSALAAAVSGAGGLGSLPAAMLSAEALELELRTLRAALGPRPCNVNFFCHVQPAPEPAREQAWRATLAPWYAELGLDPGTVSSGPGRLPFNRDLLEVLLRHRPAVVSFHFGLPEPDLLQALKSSGVRVLSSATTVDEARWLEAHGADAVIAQGLEAGGHRGHFLSDDLSRQMGTLALVRQVLRAVRVPVIAAGAIADAQGVSAALALGAAGVQVGTAWLLCPEARTSVVHRCALSSEGAQHTVITNLFTGRPARGIVNRVIRELGALRTDLPPFPLASGAIGPLRAAAEARNSGDFSPLWAGQNVSGCAAVPAAQLLHRLSGL